MDTRKYIIIPDYKPLYAMRKCWGPTHGPLNKPVLTPISVIGELLLQTPPEDLTIYEVEKRDNGFSETVQLTLSNYKLPYDEIIGKVIEMPSTKLEDIEPAAPAEPVIPTVIAKDIEAEPTGEFSDLPMEETTGQPLESEPVEQVSEDHATDGRQFVVEGTSVDTDTEDGEDTDSSDEDAAEEPDNNGTQDSSEETSDPVTVVTVPAEQSVDMPFPPELKNDLEANDPYAGMSKSQRKKARREARLAAAEATATEIAGGKDTPNEE